MRKYLKTLVFLLFTTSIFANPIHKIWEAINNKDTDLAKSLIEKAIKNPTTKVDATLIKILLLTIEGEEENLPIFQNIYEDLDDHSAYLYALWFSDAAISNYEKKEKDRLAFLKKILADKRVNNAVKGDGNYVLSKHYEMMNQLDKSIPIWDETGVVKNWSFVGPFDNASKSGFEKQYAPIKEPSKDAIFKSKMNADIQWFTPIASNIESWTTSYFYINASEAINYSQSFVESPEDRNLTLNIGGSGNLKVWINDQLILAEEEEIISGYDYFSRKCTLNKGYNRILVQNGYSSDVIYPNFALRFEDEKGEIVNLNSIASPQPYTIENSVYNETNTDHFAEAYFEAKVEKDPQNALNYILLAKSYARSSKDNKAIKVLKKIEKIYPNDLIIKFELIQAYGEVNDRTETLKTLESMRLIAPNSVFMAIVDYEQHVAAENLIEAEKAVDRICETFGKDSESGIEYRIQILSLKNDVQGLLDLIDEAFTKYPSNVTFLSYKFNVLNSMGKTDEAEKLYENYLKNNYNYQISTALISLYKKTGNNKKLEELYKKEFNKYSYDSRFVNNLVNFYYNQKDFKESMKYLDMGLKNSPYSSSFLKDKGTLFQSMNDNDKAVNYFRKSLHYNPNQFEVRNKIRDLEGKKPLIDYYKIDNINEIIQRELNAANVEEEDDNFLYIFDNANYFVFEEGSELAHFSTAIKILNQEGIDYWKETSLGYNRSRERLIIEKAEVVKKNGQIVQGERNGNEIVFTSLEIGDAVFLQYRLEKNARISLNKEFWFNYSVNGYVPVRAGILAIHVPKGEKLNIEKVNVKETVVKSSLEEFDKYEWTFVNPEKCKDEYYMPISDEACMSIQVSSLDSWSSISDWYQDLALPRAKEDHNLAEVYDNIFSQTNYKTDYEKAEAIYNYIGENVRYSSVDFRQSNAIPQKPMTTISTRLGDCKDISTLYHTLAKKAGLKTNLVLVLTRDNGEYNLKTPNTDFNHCIVKIDLKDKILFQELTDSKLPFGAIPDVISNAQALVIPNLNADQPKGELINIPSQSIFQDGISRKVEINIEEEFVNINSMLTISGAQNSNYRNHFSGISKEDTRKKVINLCNSPFKNSLDLIDYKLINKDEVNKNFQLKTEFKVEDETLNIGGVTAFKVPFFDVVFNLNYFPAEERKHPLLYWLYESVDDYDLSYSFKLNNDANFVDLPENKSVHNNFIDYDLKFEKISNTEIKMERKVKTKRGTIKASDYEAFRETIKEIVKAEDIYISYK